MPSEASRNPGFTFTKSFGRRKGPNRLEVPEDVGNALGIQGHVGIRYMKVKVRPGRLPRVAKLRNHLAPLNSITSSHADTARLKVLVKGVLSISKVKHNIIPACIL